MNPQKDDKVYSINSMKLTRQFDVLFLILKQAFTAIFEKVQAKVIAVWVKKKKTSKSKKVEKISPYLVDKKYRKLELRYLDRCS